jgi:hypothetical protein
MKIGKQPMANKPSERSKRAEHVPSAPTPIATSARDGLEQARSEARKFLPNAVRLLAGIAFSESSEASLHTRALCTRQIVEIAGVIPQATPTAPAPLHDGVEHEGHA